MHHTLHSHITLKHMSTFRRRPESMIAPYLTSLQSRLQPRGVQIGSYPLLGKGVFVSLIGRDYLTSSPQLSSSLSVSAVPPYFASAPPSSPSSSLLDIAREVETEIGGCIVSEEDIVKCKEGGPIPSVRNSRRTLENKAKC